MSSNIDKKSVSACTFLIEMSWNTPKEYARYCRYDKDIVFSGNTFSAIPTMEIELPKKDGTTKTSTVEITTETNAFFDSLRTTHPPIDVIITEINPLSLADPGYVHYRGKITLAEFNYNGHPGLVRLIVSGTKKYLESGVSFPLSQFCPWIFGNSPCNYNREATKQTRTITSANLTTIMLSSPIAFDLKQWKFGTIRRKGFEISINDQKSGTELVLSKPIPNEWLSQSVDILWGCDGTIESCKIRGQESSFCGIGLKLPDRDIRLDPL